MRERYITILYRAIKIVETPSIDICVTHDGKVGCNTVEYTSVFSNFLYSDWPYSIAWYECTVCNVTTEVTCAQALFLVAVENKIAF